MADIDRMDTPLETKIDALIKAVNDVYRDPDAPSLRRRA
jgi:hypothetical protein